jgi:hypothetical protein
MRETLGQPSHIDDGSKVAQAPSSKGSLNIG